MSKVYSFRLSDENPREAQAREVIEAWVAKGYSLRYIISEALISLSSSNSSNIDIKVIFEYFENIIAKLELNQIESSNGSDNSRLSNALLEDVKQSARDGLTLD